LDTEEATMPCAQPDYLARLFRLMMGGRSQMLNAGQQMIAPALTPVEESDLDARSSNIRQSRYHNDPLTHQGLPPTIRI